VNGERDADAERFPGDRSEDPEPHHALNNPVEEPDETEWPDPYDKRDDPPSGSTSTSEPHPSQDPEAEQWEAPERDRLDD
jgi:hypothetical protein